MCTSRRAFPPLLVTNTWLINSCCTSITLILSVDNKRPTFVSHVEAELLLNRTRRRLSLITSYLVANWNSTNNTQIALMCLNKWCRRETVAGRDRAVIWTSATSRIVQGNPGSFIMDTDDGATENRFAP